MTRALTTVSLRTAGGLLLLIGVGHMFMPEWGYAPSAVAGMADLVEEHFYYLGTYAIGSFLLAFGIMSFVMRADRIARRRSRLRRSWGSCGSFVWRWSFSIRFASGFSCCTILILS